MSSLSLSSSQVPGRRDRLSPVLRCVVSDSDGELMVQAIDGSVKAFGELYDRYRGRAYRVALAVCRDSGLAQDAVQEAFLAVWRSRASYCPQRGTVAAWLLSSVHYRAIDIMRHHARQLSRRASDEDHAKDRPAPGDVCEQVIRRAGTAAVLAALSQLPVAQQEVIALAVYGELSHTEIAAHLGLPVGTVKGRMRLGLHKLRDGIEPAA